MTNMKPCVPCGASKPRTEFSKHAKTKDGLQSWCKTCVNIYSHKWHATNRDRINTYSRAYDAANPGIQKETSRKWAAANPERGILYNHRRRVRRLANGIFAVTIKEIKHMLTQPCYLCNVSLSTTIDHIIPVSKGGRHSIGNLLGACDPCNGKKFDKYLIEYQNSERDNSMNNTTIATAWPPKK